MVPLGQQPPRHHGRGADGVEGLQHQAHRHRSVHVRSVVEVRRQVRRREEPELLGQGRERQAAAVPRPITFVPQENGPQRLASLEAGDFQAMHTSGPKQIMKIRTDVKNGTLKDTESDHFTEVGYTMLNICSGAGNGCPQASPFAHLSARQAFAYGVDRVTFNKLRNDGILQQASGPFARASTVTSPTPACRNFDPPRRRPRLRSTRRRPASTLTFTLNHTADPDTTQDAVLIQQMLKQNAGISVSLNPVADQSTLINIGGRQEVRRHVVAEPPGCRRRHAVRVVALQQLAGRGRDPNPCDNPSTSAASTTRSSTRTSTGPGVDRARRQRTALYQNINKTFAKTALQPVGPVHPVDHCLQARGARHSRSGLPVPGGRSSRSRGSPTGHPVDGMWCDGGKCT